MKEKQAILVIDFKNIIISSSSIANIGQGNSKYRLVSSIKIRRFDKYFRQARKTREFTNFNGSATTTNTFDYVSYLGKDDIFYKIDFAKNRTCF